MIQFPELNRDSKTAIHAYELEVSVGYQRGYLTVYAYNRNQAASIAKKSGYVVDSVNMVG